jgi:hypothetical protein
MHGKIFHRSLSIFHARNAAAVPDATPLSIDVCAYSSLPPAVGPAAVVASDRP